MAFATGNGALRVRHIVMMAVIAHKPIIFSMFGVSKYYIAAFIVEEHPGGNVLLGFWNQVADHSQEKEGQRHGADCKQTLGKFHGSLAANDADAVACPSLGYDVGSRCAPDIVNMRLFGDLRGFHCPFRQRGQIQSPQRRHNCDNKECNQNCADDIEV